MGNEYFFSTPGIVKIVELILNAIAFICIAASTGSAEGDAFLVASVGAFLLTAILLIIRVMELDQRIPIPWGKVELGYCAVWGLFYLIASAVVISVKWDAYIAGGSFGLFAVVVYIYDAYDKFRNDND